MDRNKKALALLSACLLALVPWMQISKAVSSDVTVSVRALAAVVAAGVAIHLAFLAFNMAAVAVLRIGGKDKAACRPPHHLKSAMGAHSQLSIQPVLPVQPLLHDSGSEAQQHVEVCWATCDSLDRLWRIHRSIASPSRSPDEAARP